MSDIAQMTAEEIRLEIARVKGYNPQNVNWDSTIHSDWTTSIADAWELVEELTDNTLHENCCTFSMKRTDGWEIGQDRWGYEVTFGKVFRHGKDDIAAWADTAPLAISKAWLMWKQSNA